jgi:hypothetical protein
MHVVCWGGPLIVSILIAVFAHYGDAVVWCWISSVSPFPPSPLSSSLLTKRAFSLIPVARMSLQSFSQCMPTISHGQDDPMWWWSGFYGFVAIAWVFAIYCYVRVHQSLSAHLAEAEQVTRLLRIRLVNNQINL